MIAAFDSSIANCGFCVMKLEDGEIVISGVLHTQKGAAMSKMERERFKLYRPNYGFRVLELERKVASILGLKKVDIRFAWVEVPEAKDYARVTRGTGKQTNKLSMYQMAGAADSILGILAEWGIHHAGVTPNFWKGTRGKWEDQIAAQRQLGRTCRDDESDAVAMCRTLRKHIQLGMIKLPEVKA